MDSRAPPEKLRYTVIYYTCEAVKSADQLQEVINMADTCFRKTGMSHIFPKPHKYAIIESKKVLKKQHLKGEEKCRKSK